MNPKFFILEGPDRSGKSTLARFIAQHLNIRTNVVEFHMDFNKKLASAMFEYQTSVLNNLIRNFEQHHCSIVLDRCWISNYVYGLALDNQEVHDWTHLRATLLNLGAVYIMCDCESAFDRQIKQPDPQHPYDEVEFREIITLYRTAPHDLLYNDNVVRYDLDVHGNDLNKFMQELGI